MNKTRAKVTPLAGAVGGPKPLSEEEKKQAIMRQLAAKQEVLFQGILFNAVNSGVFGKDLNAAVDASFDAAQHAMEKLYTTPAEQPEE